MGFFDKIVEIESFKIEKQALCKLREMLIKDCKEVEAVVVMRAIERYDQGLATLQN